MTSPSAGHRAPRAGFTLVEVLVALGLFGLIALAGFTLLEGIVGTRDRLDGRLDRLAELQRAMYVITVDFEALDNGPIELGDNGLAFRRRSPTSLRGSTAVRYFVADGALRRRVGASGDQRLITDVANVEWTFHFADRGWSPTPGAAVSGEPPQVPAARPDAVALTVDLNGSDGLTGRLRRVVELPALP
jgi:general secretion pathway protein J